MSKKTGPSVEPQRIRRPRTAVRSTAPASRTSTSKKKSARISSTDKIPADLSIKAKIRHILFTLTVPIAVILGVIISGALLILLLTETSMAALPATIALGWLAFNAAPLSGEDVVISYVPLAPPLLFACVQARTVYRLIKDRVSLYDLAVIACAVLGIPTALTLIAAGMLFDASVVFPVAVPPLLHAVGATVLLHLLALVVGMGPRLWRALIKRAGLSPNLIDGAVAAVRFIAYCLAASLVVLLISLGFHYHVLSELVQVYSPWGIVGASILSLLYVPNFMIATLALLSGSEAIIGQATISLFGINLVALPPLPLMAAIPQSAHSVAPSLLAIPAGVAIYVAVKARLNALESAVAVSVATVLNAALIYFGRGELGVYGLTGPHVIAIVLVPTIFTTALFCTWATATVQASRRTDNESSISNEPDPSDTGNHPEAATGETEEDTSQPELAGSPEVAGALDSQETEEIANVSEPVEPDKTDSEPELEEKDEEGVIEVGPLDSEEVAEESEPVKPEANLEEPIAFGPERTEADLEDIAFESAQEEKETEN
ncbi:DUF6350 family protein [Corynebacterium sp. ES2794-CONJ1]|uniref:cell division protein PerM n=1 Tax=Corynebacterium sp. ES2794-CONJ1 TaxID=2980553 RepID=UPI0021D80CCC|nr:DUF6350 family protein [Corynebacterium sp. ES2794-CONJ1]MCU9519108.1 DUF6350 family protein [Corynebacterium sp. ES2794-CONJ1]